MELLNLSDVVTFLLLGDLEDLFQSLSDFVFLLLVVLQSLEECLFFMGFAVLDKGRFVGEGLGFSGELFGGFGLGC